MLLASKCVARLQSVFGKFAVGVPLYSCKYGNGAKHGDPYPIVRVNGRGSRGDIRGCVSVPGEEPNFDEAVRAFHGVPPSANSVQRGSIAVCGRCLHAASAVPVRVNVTVVDRRGSRLATARGHRTVCACVNGDRVRRDIVDALNPSARRLEPGIPVRRNDILTAHCRYEE